MIVAILILFGLAFGSFINALVWRIHEQHKPKKKRAGTDAELSIATGRSMCTHCKHTLVWYDLLPVLSWISLGGKCRYCKKPIGIQYPLVEIVTTMLFVVSYLFWPLGLGTVAEVTLFGLWLVSLIALVALAVYDIRWMLLPNRIVFPLTGIAVLYAIISTITSQNVGSALINAIGGLAVAGGIFYVLFQVSDGKWIGGGDVKLGFALGLLLASPLLAFLMLFVASLLGIMFALPALLQGKTSASTKIPFGPFLIAATIITQLFGRSIIDWYSTMFLYV